jgi:hypothetical protein
MLLLAAKPPVFGPCDPPHAGHLQICPGGALARLARASCADPLAAKLFAPSVGVGSMPGGVAPVQARDATGPRRDPALDRDQPPCRDATGPGGDAISSSYRGDLLGLFVRQSCGSLL